MRKIRYSTQFTRDYRRKNAGRHRASLDDLFLEVVRLLSEDQPLPARHYDHALTGEWKDHRDCHIKPDLVLIYRTPDKDTLELVRLGSHSELF